MYWCMFECDRMLVAGLLRRLRWSLLNILTADGAIELRRSAQCCTWHGVCKTGSCSPLIACIGELGLVLNWYRGIDRRSSLIVGISTKLRGTTCI